MKKVFTVLFLIGVIISCRLLDRVEEQKADVTITFEYSQIGDRSGIGKIKSTASSIDKAELVIYDIDYSYSDVSNNYTDMDIQSLRPSTDFEYYWVNGVEDALDEISSDNCTIESRHDLTISNNQASGEFEIDAGVKYFLVGLFEDNILRYSGYSGVENFKLGDSKTVDISLNKANTAPTIPYDPSPADRATNVEIITGTKLFWECTDVENDLLTYDIYFGESTNPPLVKSSHNYRSYSTGSWQYDKEYYWKIVAKDNYGNTSEGPIWSFRTKSEPSVTQITGTAQFQPGIIGELGGSFAFLYTSLDNWSTYNSIHSGAVSGSGSSVSFQLTGINPGNYYFDVWKDNDNNHEWSIGDFVGWYGSGDLNSLVVTEFQISEGQTFNVDITMYVLQGINTVIDVDGNVYNTVTIGNQVWMTENLKVTHYRNGDSIPNVTDITEWSNLTSGAYSTYNNNDYYFDTYGALYNWYVINDPRGLAPDGWHIPTDDEWWAMIVYLGGSSVAGSKLKETGTAHWLSPNTGATNESGFSALPGGRRTNDGTFTKLGERGYFWTNSLTIDGAAYMRHISYNGSSVSSGVRHKQYGYSIRCIKD